MKHPEFTTKEIALDGATVSVTVGGHGPVIVLLHGYAEDSRMWKPLAAKLASSFTVVVPDLPGIGNSSIPADGIDMVSSAKRIRDAVHALGFSKVTVVGHDIGLMVAYAYAAMFRDEVQKLALMDAFLPGIAGWEPIYNDPAAWHFRFYGPTPVALVTGRERLYFEHFWNDFAADPKHSIPEKEREGVCCGVRAARAHGRRVRVLRKLFSRRRKNSPCSAQRSSEYRCSQSAATTQTGSRSANRSARSRRT